MKKRVVIFALTLLALPVLAQKKVSEVDAIKAAIEKESNAFFEINHDAWIDSWVHAPYSYWSFVDSEGMSHYEGWNAIEIGFNDYFITSKPSNSKIERQWLETRVYGTGAFVRFKQRIITNGVPGVEQTEIRILEKDKDKKDWKIVLVGVLKKS